MRLILITGMSGAGKGVALRALEDAGFEAMDNLPLSLVKDVVEKRKGQDIAIDVDIRSREFTSPQFLQLIDALKTLPDLSVTTLFLDCDDEVIRKRYTESRRPHPLAADRPVMDGIRLERSLIEPLKLHADITLDTTETTVHDLKRLLLGHIGTQHESFNVHVTSFSYRLGVPREADLVFDVRFLRNPHYDERLRPHTGLDPEVGEYIAQDKDYSSFMAALTALLLQLLPRYKEEGKRYLTIAMGCTGGKHRSVFTAETIKAAIEKAGYPVSVHHRDVAKG